MKNLRKGDWVFTLILLAYALYAALFIQQTSFVIEGKRYYSLFDDAMVSMRYAKNLAHGYGLVWNPGGERVEGYTNLLWVLYMSLFHLLPVAPSKISLFIQISGAVFLLANLFFVRKIADLVSNGSVFVSVGAAFLTAFYLPLNNWSLQGMEVGVLTLIVSASIWKALRCMQQPSFSIWLYILLGVGTLIRIDMAILFLAILAFLIYADPKNRRSNLVWGTLVLTFFILLQTLFRLWYYGDILPNTYYLKMTGFPFWLRISRGLWVFLDFTQKLNWILFLVPFSIPLFRRDKVILFLLWVFVAQAMYSIYVGGDAWEPSGGSNRYVSIVMPVFFILFCFGLTSNALFSISATRYAKYGMAALIVIGFINFNSMTGLEAMQEVLLVKPTLHITDNKRMVTRALLLTKITNPQAKIAVVWAGAIPYFSDRYAIDLLGKSDRKIAHLDMRIPLADPLNPITQYTSFYPGHLKWDYGYSIGELKPDVVAQLWEGKEEAYEYLDRDYTSIYAQGFTLYLRKASANVLWDQLKAIQ